MSTTAAIIIAIAAIVVLGAIAFTTLARRSDVRGAGALSAETVRRDSSARKERAAVEAEAVAARTAAVAEAEGVAARAGTGLAPVDTDTGLTPWTPPDPEALGVSRRQFFNRASIGLMGASIGTFSAAAFVAFLWPSSSGGFGGKVNIGRLADIRAGIDSGNGFNYQPAAQAWITEYPVEAISKAQGVYDDRLFPGMEQGIIASWQKCPHLGCRVPECVSSQFFECGCHGSQYNRVGEKKARARPRAASTTSRWRSRRPAR